LTGTLVRSSDTCHCARFLAPGKEKIFGSRTELKYANASKVQAYEKMI